MASHRGLDAQPSAKSARGRAADKRDELAPLHVTAQWLETNTLRSVGEREMVRGRRKMVLRLVFHRRSFHTARVIHVGLCYFCLSLHSGRAYSP